jgi:hypothetical protein
MKRCIVGLATVALLFLGGVGQVSVGFIPGSGDPFTFSFNETGAGTINFGDGIGNRTFNGTLLADPASPGNLGLTWIFPPQAPGGTATLVASGDVRVTEPGGGTSEWLRFTNGSGDLSGARVADRMIFYSDKTAGEPAEPNDIADQTFPTNLGSGPSQGITSENATTGAFRWAPGEQQTPQTVDNIYLGQSDTDVAVPEPATITLLCLGIAGMGGYGWRKRKVAAA